MQLRSVATVTARLDPPVMVGPGPYGVRAFIRVADGTLDGDGLSGTVLPGGGDWALLGADGWCRIGVRTMFATADGATIYAQLPGLLEMAGALQVVSVVVPFATRRTHWPTSACIRCARTRCGETPPS